MYKKDPIKSPVKNRLKRICSGSDSIMNFNGQVYLKSSGEKLVENKDLAKNAMKQLVDAMNRYS